MNDFHPRVGVFADLRFDNRFVRELPGDPVAGNMRRQVNGACYSRIEPARVCRPELVAYSREMAESLGMCRGPRDDQAPESVPFAEIFCGNRLLPGMDPFATCYGGHQFGSWAGQLGDGRAINLGELIDVSGQRQTLQLKGAGLTPYSRTADGLAVLRSSIREFLCSEAMHHLGVPTTRALSIVATGEEVVRDMFYDGHPRVEPGAVVCRVAPSFTRFGSFELFTARREFDLLRQLADYTIRHDFPHLGEPCEKVYVEWFEDVCRHTADMIVHWMRVGFVHGVMNTDNMSVLGLTIDYGPYGWVEGYDPGWTPNTTDAAGRRYSFGNQPHIALWNLMRFANAIYPLIEEERPLRDALEGFSEEYARGWRTMMAGKLGLRRFDTKTDEVLVKDLNDVLQLVETDMTLFFRSLADINIDVETAAAQSDEDLMAPITGAYYVAEELTGEYKARMSGWLRDYIRRSSRDAFSAETRRNNMNAVNPKYVLRNYLAQLAIDRSEQGDHAMVADLLDVLRSPYDEQPDRLEFAKKRPDWARNRPGCSMLSCSS